MLSSIRTLAPARSTATSYKMRLRFPSGRNLCLQYFFVNHVILHTKTMLDSIPWIVLIYTALGEGIILYVSVSICIDLLDARNNVIPQKSWKGNLIAIYTNPFTFKRHEGVKHSKIHYVVTRSSTNTQWSYLHALVP
jgi:hypothetical protein